MLPRCVFRSWFPEAIWKEKQGGCGRRVARRWDAPNNEYLRQSQRRHSPHTHSISFSLSLVHTNTRTHTHYFSQALTRLPLVEGFSRFVALAGYDAVTNKWRETSASRGNENWEPVRNLLLAGREDVMSRCTDLSFLVSRGGGVQQVRSVLG